jgi:transcriptional regulator with XRE-family HTH domain
VIDDPEFARRIRAARAYLGMNLTEAGEVLGMSPHRLSRRERADVNGMRMTVEDRRQVMKEYIRLTGWPREFFIDEVIPVSASRVDDPGDLSAAEVLDLVDRHPE